LLEPIKAEKEKPMASEELIPQKQHFEVILDNIRSAYNVGAIFRIADGAGIKHLYLCGITPNPKGHPAIGKTALGAEDEVPWSYHPNALDVAHTLREKGYHLLALERRSESILLPNFSTEFLNGQPLGLILGNERAGVDPGLIGLCDTVIALPMVGKKASLNVAVAFGIAAYWLSFR
jgi:tRNA G18 (ribose-2'-O)-methylase SpoU